MVSCQKPNNNSRESSLGPYAETLSEIDADEPSEGKPARKSERAKPTDPGGGGDGDAAPGGRQEKGEAAPEGETPGQG